MQRKRSGGLARWAVFGVSVADNWLNHPQPTVPLEWPKDTVLVIMETEKIICMALSVFLTLVSWNKMD